MQLVSGCPGRLRRHAERPGDEQCQLQQGLEPDIEHRGNRHGRGVRLALHAERSHSMVIAEAIIMTQKKEIAQLKQLIADLEGAATTENHSIPNN